MKVIVAGTRTITSYVTVVSAIMESDFEITELVSGSCRGVDKLGEMYVSIHKIPIKRFPPNWMKYSTLAGPKRNQEMANYADCLVLVWDGISKGSKDMLNKMKTAGKPVYVKYI